MICFHSWNKMRLNSSLGCLEKISPVCLSDMKWIFTPIIYLSPDQCSLSSSLIVVYPIPAAGFLALEIHSSIAIVSFFFFCVVFFSVVASVLLCKNIQKCLWLFISLSALGNVSIQAIKLLRVWFCGMSSKRCWDIYVFLDRLGWVWRTFIPSGIAEDQALIGVKFRTNSHQCLTRICVRWRRRSLMLCWLMLISISLFRDVLYMLPRGQLSKVV